MIAFQPGLEPDMTAGRRRPPQPAQMPLPLRDVNRRTGMPRSNGTAHAWASGTRCSAPSSRT